MDTHNYIYHCVLYNMLTVYNRTRGALQLTRDQRNNTKSRGRKSVCKLSGFSSVQLQHSIQDSPDVGIDAPVTLRKLAYPCSIHLAGTSAALVGATWARATAEPFELTPSDAR